MRMGRIQQADTAIYRAIIQEAARDGLPTATHTGSAADVKDAVGDSTQTALTWSTVDLIPGVSIPSNEAEGESHMILHSAFSKRLADLNWQLRASRDVR